MTTTSSSSDFRQFHAQSTYRFTFSSMLISIGLLLGTLIIDYLFQQEQFMVMLKSKFFYSGVLLVTAIIVARLRRDETRQPMVVLYTVLAVVALLHSGRLSLVPYNHYYNVSPIIMVLFCFVLIRLRFSWAVTCTVVLFIVSNIFWLSRERETLDVVFVQNFMLSAACIYSLMAAWVMERAVRQQYESQQALQSERDNLLELQNLERQRSWLREKLDDYQLRISGNQEAAALARITMDFLGESLEPGLAVIYEYHGDQLIRLAARGTTEGFPEQLAPGEGLTGEAARQPEVMIVDDLPDNYPRIRSATGAMLPRQLLLAPLRFEQQNQGVIELAFVHPPDTTQHQLATELAERLAQALMMAQARQTTEHANA